MLKILMVCMGNICRSPMAEAVARALAKEQGLSAVVDFDSAGTHAYHVGEPPDERACQVGARRGYQLHQLRARKVAVEDFQCFDLILASDRQNLEALRRLCPEAEQAKLRLLLDFADDIDVDEVPDPYYGSIAGFERVLELCERAADGLLDYVRRAEGIR